MRTLPPRMEDKLNHNMIFNEETIEIKEKARDFAVRIIAPSAFDITHQVFGRKRSGFSLYRGKPMWSEATNEGKLTSHSGGPTSYTGKQWIEGDMLCYQEKKAL